MRRLEVRIPMPDGRSEGTLHVPDGDGPWPGVLMFPDAGGPRETFGQMGDRLADPGYVVLIPDIYYRGGRWAPFDVNTLFTDPKERARMSTLARPLTNDRIIADGRAYADFPLARPEVTGPSSPHLAADRIAATVYVAGATGDGSFTAAQAGLLDRALTAAGVEHTLEIYPARHGFAVPDNPTYDADADARHWAALGRLYQARL